MIFSISVQKIDVNMQCYLPALCGAGVRLQLLWCDVQMKDLCLLSD